MTEFPKPWRTYQDEDDWLMDANGRKIIVNLLGMDDLRLIAAASDMLAALKAVNHDRVITDAIWLQVTAAIAKAEGRS